MLMFNDGWSDWEWNATTISGTGSGERSMELIDEGILIGGTSLTDVKVSVENNDEKKELTFTTDRDSVLLIQENVNGDILPAVYVDKDNDGIYETLLGTELNPDDGEDPDDPTGNPGDEGNSNPPMADSGNSGNHSSSGNGKGTSSGNGSISAHDLPSSAEIITGTWIKDANGWWLRKPDGTYPKTQWARIDGAVYRFDETGYMIEGWFFFNDK